MAAHFGRFLIGISIALVSCSRLSHEQEVVHSLEDILTSRHKAIQLSEEWRGTPATSIPQDVLEKMKVLNEDMLKRGKTLDAGTLNSIYPELGTMFIQAFLPCLTIAVQYEDEGIAKRARGEIPLSSPADIRFRNMKELEVRWDEWFVPRTHEIAEAMKRKW